MRKAGSKTTALQRNGQRKSTVRKEMVRKKPGDMPLPHRYIDDIICILSVVCFFFQSAIIRCARQSRIDNNIFDPKSTFAIFPCIVHLCTSYVLYEGACSL